MSFSEILALIFAVGYLGTTLWLCRSYRFHVRDLCLGGICIAMTCVLSYVYILLPTGASITIGSWLPLMTLALIYDYRLAMLSGMICGILAPMVLPGWEVAHWAQFFLEHLAIFSCMGYAGLFGYEKKSKILLGVCLAVTLRFTAQVLSGVVFFGEYAWEGYGAWAYSLIYHLTARIPEGILTGALLLAMPLDRLSKFAKRGLQK